ncbi:cupin [Tunturibacter psychrotolerans]|uniref:Cupin n=1 Tax=Tunturiibacter psychrotolerans TaxID=3069686 RepID=A0AAU7ZLI6_9BACT
MDRRKFAASLVAASLGSSQVLASKVGNSSPPNPQQLHLKPNGWMPNSPLPVLLYRSALPSSANLAADMERIFAANGWPPQWRNGVYAFHHYHSTAHEVLGFAAGHADLMLGGEGGETVTVHAGDVLVLPTGTGHCRISASHDFLVIGAYPENEHWDICRSTASPETLASMRKIRFPQSDPLTGSSGALPKLWI